MAKSIASDPVCVIGAGGSGLAAVKALSERGIPVTCFEQGSNVGGNWRYENDSGASAAYRSLRCNVSRRLMQYPSFPMPRSYGDFPSHTDMAAYLEAYTAAFRLGRHIRFSTKVESAGPVGDGRWRVSSSNGIVEEYRAVVIANGHHWAPKWPALAGESSVTAIHSHDYRTPDPFRGKRVLVIGAGQSGVEIATELAPLAARTILSVRSGAHVLPRYLFGQPFDGLDIELANRLPWPLLNWILDKLVRVARGGDPSAYGFRRPAHRVLEQIPVVSSALLPALRRGSIAVRPEVERVDGCEVRFADASTECVDAIVCATGYRISLPFLAPSLLEVRGAEVPLYRRIASSDAPGLYFVGLVDAPSGLLPIVELQAAWLADILEGVRTLPDRTAMQAAIDAAERRTRERFPLEPLRSIRCDPYAYIRLLRRDRRRRRGQLRWKRVRPARAEDGHVQGLQAQASPDSTPQRRPPITPLRRFSRYRPFASSPR